MRYELFTAKRLIPLFCPEFRPDMEFIAKKEKSTFKIDRYLHVMKNNCQYKD